MDRTADVCCDTCWGYDDRHPCICPGPVDPAPMDLQLLPPAPRALLRHFTRGEEAF